MAELYLNPDHRFRRVLWSGRGADGWLVRERGGEHSGRVMVSRLGAAGGTTQSAATMAQDYNVPTVPTFTIYGVVRANALPLEGVVMNGLPGNPSTNAWACIRPR